VRHAAFPASPPPCVPATKPPHPLSPSPYDGEGGRSGDPAHYLTLRILVSSRCPHLRSQFATSGWRPLRGSVGTQNRPGSGLGSAGPARSAFWSRPHRAAPGLHRALLAPRERHGSGSQSPQRAPLRFSPPQEPPPGLWVGLAPACAELSSKSRNLDPGDPAGRSLPVDRSTGACYRHTAVRLSGGRPACGEPPMGSPRRMSPPPNTWRRI